MQDIEANAAAMLNGTSTNSTTQELRGTGLRVWGLGSMEGKSKCRGPAVRIHRRGTFHEALECVWTILSILLWLTGIAFSYSLRRTSKTWIEGLGLRIQGVTFV